MMSSSAIVAFNLKEGKNWWWDVNESPVWQDRIFHVLAVLYGIVSVIAVVPFTCPSGFELGLELGNVLIWNRKIRHLRI